MIRFRTLVECVALSFLVAACAGPSKSDKGTPREAKTEKHPWTASFADSSVVIAQTIEVTGPKGLLDHIAIQQDSEDHSHSESATKDGMRIEEAQKPDSGGTPIRAQLDNLKLYADQRLVVLESPSATHVVVQASGDVYFRSETTGEEKRLPTLRLVGAD